MLLELISRYYNILWFLLVIIAFAKIMLSYQFHGNLEGVNGVVYALFKWYGEEEQEMEEFGPRRTTMRLHNVITLAIYVVIGIIVIASLLPMILPSR